MLAELAQHAANGVIHRRGHSGIGSTFAVGNMRKTLFVLGGRLERRVDSVESKVQKERRVLVSLDKGRRFSPEGVRQILGIFWDLDTIAQQTISFRRIRQIGTRTTEEDKGLVEPTLVRSQAFLETDMPLAHHARGVTSGLELLGERRHGHAASRSSAPHNVPGPNCARTRTDADTCLISPAREGEQTGCVAYPSVNRTPLAAIESMCGVGMSCNPDSRDRHSPDRLRE